MDRKNAASEHDAVNKSDFSVKNTGSYWSTFGNA